LYKAKVTISLRKTILDPQGKTVENSLHHLGYKNITDTRIGKHIEFLIDTPDERQAAKIIEEACQKLLANPVMEDYTYQIEKAE